MIKLREDYQQPVKDAIGAAWAAHRAVLAVMATGGGKTIVFSSIVADHKGAAAVVVHRKEIVLQISNALAMFGVPHRLIAQADVIRTARRQHLDKYGKSFVDDNALVGVASVQTLASKGSEKNAPLQAWIKQVTLCVYDEGHHYVKAGLWAKAVDCMVNAKMLQVTACPERADGKGLGANADGFAEVMVEGPQVKWLIDQGYLSPFKYYAPPTDFNVADVAVTASGDFNAKAFRAQVVESHLVGDVVEQYLKYAKGKRAIVFATDVKTSEEMEGRFLENSVPTIALDGSTDNGVRDRASASFVKGDTKVLCNVDLFDEGYDVPAADCAIIARPTQSLNKFLQMCGRVLRVVYADGFDLSTAEGRKAAIAAGPKPYAVIIDPVSNWRRHGMPDWPRVWTLAGREKKETAASDTIPMKLCGGCTQPYEGFYKVCPHCGFAPEPPARREPEQVDGDLAELDVDALAALFDKMKAADSSDEDFMAHQIARGVPPIGRSAGLKRHKDAKYRREVLRNLVGWWVGAQKDRELSEIHRRFFLRFGIDIGNAFTLNAKDTDALSDKITRLFALDTSGV